MPIHLITGLKKIDALPTTEVRPKVDGEDELAKAEKLPIKDNSKERQALIKTEKADIGYNYLGPYPRLAYRTNLFDNIYKTNISCKYLNKSE